MKKIGPFKIGERIPHDTPVGKNYLTLKLWIPVGDIPEEGTMVPGYTDRQDINVAGVVISEPYMGPPSNACTFTLGLLLAEGE